MSNLYATFLRDECGFIVSAELVLVATIVVIGLIVGLAELQSALNAELNDVGDAIGSLNQSFYTSGFSAEKAGGEVKSHVSGSFFVDRADDCDNNQCDISCDDPMMEAPKFGNGGNND